MYLLYGGTLITLPNIANVIFISRPQLELMNLIAENVHREEGKRPHKEFHLFYMPHKRIKEFHLENDDHLSVSNCISYIQGLYKFRKSQEENNSKVWEFLKRAKVISFHMFVARLPHMLAIKQSLARRKYTIAEMIKEQELLDCIDTEKPNAYIEDMIAQQKD
ncbi:VP33A protein, partial [Acromyrmex heyeri]